MLKSLSIKNLAVIKDAYIEFENGLNVLTGETGAGKSIIIDSLNLIMGNRAFKEIIRNGENYARVEALFYVEKDIINQLEEYGISFDDGENELVIMREINLDGKNIIRINGRLSNLSLLKEIGILLINIHGQNENQDLMKKEKHIDYLDNYADNSDLLTLYREIYNEAMLISNEINKLQNDTEDKERKISLLTYEIECIEKANLQKGEYEELSKKRKLISESQKITDNLSDAYIKLNEGVEGISAESLISSAVGKISDISGCDDSLNDLSLKLNDVYYNLVDIIENINNLSSEYGFDEEEINITEKRIDELNDIRRRFGNDYDTVISYYNKIKKELSDIEFSDENLERLKKELSEKKKVLKETADKLTKSRKEAAIKLEQSIIKELSELNMKNTLFKVDMISEDKFTKDGIDKVEFLMSANAGMELNKMAKIASGGELSRIMLAINCALLNNNKVPTMIYDEIDTGVSGRAAQKIAEKLNFVSKNHQVLCVTHLPQIAAMADNHFLIEKNISDNTTKTTVIKLKTDERKYELARILGGAEITNNTLLNAEDLIKQSVKYKEDNYD